MKKKNITEGESELFKDITRVGIQEPSISTATSNFIEETRITSAVVFRGSINLLAQILYIIENNGTLVYKKVTSPDKKLMITEEKEGDAR